MRKLKSALSILLVLCMLISAVPLSTMSVFAAETTASDTGVAGESLGIDFDYAKKNNIKSANDAIIKEAKGSYSSKTVGKDYYKSDDNAYKWHKIRNKDFTTSGGDFRKLMQSTDAKDKYLVLVEDCTSKSYTDDYQEIVIKSDKVLDLNGFKLELNDMRNKVDSSAWYELAKYFQSKNPDDHKSIMFRIDNGATLTIIDSSAKDGVDGTGMIKTYGYMINPFKHTLIYNTTRDIFWVDDGNLVIYGGTFEAGRQKDYRKSNFSWEKFKDTIGSAVELGVAVADYATGIKGAVAAKDDLNEYYKKLEENADDEEDDGSDGTNGAGSSTKKKNGEGTKKEQKESTPSGGNTNGEGRDATVDEKKKKKNEQIEEENKKTGSTNPTEGTNPANEEEVAKEDKQTKLAAAEKDIVNSIVNKDSITGMVDNAFKFAEGIASMIGHDEKTRVTETVQGTCVHLGNKGTLVTYGGHFKGYGSTPNTRNAVVEVTRHYGNDMNEATGKFQGGQAYIYDGTFEGYTGANIFNFVHANVHDQKVVQWDQDQYGNRTSKTVTLQASETMGLETMYFENAEAVAKNGAEPIPVNTSNVVVRGGTFRNHYEYFNTAIGEEGGNNFRRFAGTSGSVNLGAESYGKDFIRDGRIQIVDTYGDGALVLMDDRVDEQGKSEGVYHYRLYCGDTELRYNRYLQVYPNKAQTNSTYSMKLATYYGSGEQESMKYWCSDEENVREAPYGNDEYYFSFPIDNKELTEKYYVAPNLTNTDVYGKELNNSEVWYYNVPVDTQGKAIPDFGYGIDYISGTHKSNGTKIEQSLVSLKEDKVKSYKSDVDDKTEKYTQNIYKNYKTNLKWFTYKIYRVDPLTRENLSESKTYGVDEPLAEVVYGTSSDSLKCKLDLKDVEAEIKKKRPDWKGYQQGELYRIVFNAEEYLNFDYDGKENFDVKMDTAKAESTILFRCYSINEKKDDGSDTFIEDYTPLQWVNEPKLGDTAKIQIINGKAGQIDYMDDKIFDVYYQWWEVDKNGKPVKLLAGTTNVYDKEFAGKRYHHYTMWKVGTDGQTYVNTVNPSDPNASTYGENGLPKNQNDWNCDMLHAYTHEMTPENYYKKSSETISLANNNVFATNTDECYIPDSCVGKRIRVKAIAVNCKWTKVYDKKQVFYSHIVEIPDSREPLTGKANISVDGNYATYKKQATLSLGNVTGLTKTEKITEVTYKVNNSKVEFKNLKLSPSDKAPTAVYPKDFYAADYKLEKLGARDCDVTVTYKTSGSRTFESNVESFNYEVEATALNVGMEQYSYNLNNITVGVSNSRPIRAVPTNASVGFDYGEAVASNEKVAYINEQGYVVFGGKTGKSIITMTGPDGKDYTTTITVTDRYYDVEVSGIDAPVVGQKFDLDAVVPENAKYHVKEVYWTAGNSKEKLPANTVVEKYKNYTANVVVENNACCDKYSVGIPAKFTVNLADGTTETISDNINCNLNHFAINDDDTLTFSYKYPALGEVGTTIDKVFIDFPTEVREGDSIEDWNKKVRVYAGDGLDLDFSSQQSFSADGFNILQAYGYNNVTAETMNVFVKGVQIGPYLSIEIPEGIDLEFADSISVYVNGEKGKGQVEYKYSDSFTFGAYNTINIDGGTPLAIMPEYSVKDYDFVAGKTINVSDLLEAEDERVTLEYNKVSSYNMNDETLAQHFTADAENNSFKLLQATDNTITVYLTAYIDLNGDGKWDVKQSHNKSDKIYASQADVPAKETVSGQFTLKVVDPDGKELHSGKYNCGEKVQIPEFDGLFVKNYESNGRTYNVPSMKFAFPAKDGDVVKVNTTDADNFEVAASDTTLFADGGNASMLDISIDGVHWSRRSGAGCHIYDLQPDTEYMVYWKQDVDGIVYSKKVKTAKQCYGVYVGRTPVTNENTGNLEKDGWHYDVDTKTLTLKDLNMTTGGTVGASAGLLSVTLAMDAAIYAEQDITINLIGDNVINKISGDGFMQSVIFSKGNITFTGNGNLSTDHNAGAFGYNVYSDENIYLKGTGKYSIEGVPYMFSVPDGKVVEYHNGEISITGYKAGNSYICSLDESTTFTNKAHDIKIYACDKEAGNVADTEITEADVVNTEISRGAIHIVPAHSYTEKKEIAQAYKEGDCESGTTYFKSCSCGAISNSETFKTSAGDHDLVLHDGKNATCLEGGWKKYYTCNNCDYSSFATTKATGHDWTHHNEIDATCEAYGAPEYDECKNCGITSKITDKVVLEEMGYAPTGHDVYLKSGAPATCDTKGTEDHYSCADCDKLYNDEAGSAEISIDDISTPALGHNWGAWKVTKKPNETTKGTETRTCLTNSKHKETRTVPVTNPGCKISAKTLKLNAGATKTLKVTGATVKKWSTSTKSVATVTSKGVVTALKKGTATITATLKNGGKFTCKVTVKTSPTIKVGSKKYKKTTTYTVKKGKTLAVKITGKAKTVKNSYSTSKKSIAKVTSKTTATKVLIKGYKKGKATVTIKVNSVKFPIKVKVK